MRGDTPFALRRAMPEDGEALAAIYAPIVRDTAISFEIAPPDGVEMARRVAAAGDGWPWLACESQGRLLGYAYACRHRERAAYRWACETSVYVAEAARGRGVARSLYAALFDLLARQGYRRAWAVIPLPNPASLGLHRALGFEPAGHYADAGCKFGRWHDVAWLGRALAPADLDPGEPLSLAALGAETVASVLAQATPSR